MIWIKNHGSVLAVCDEKHLGKLYEQGKLQLDVNENFYKGELISEEKFESMLNGIENANLVGKNCINLARKRSLIADVKEIEGVPYAMIFKV
jgi:hypothetical protein